MIDGVAESAGGPAFPQEGTVSTDEKDSWKTRQEVGSPLPQLNRNSAEGVHTSQHIK